MGVAICLTGVINIVWLNFTSNLFYINICLLHHKRILDLVFVCDTSFYDKGCSRNFYRNSLEVSKATTMLKSPGSKFKFRNKAVHPMSFYISIYVF